ncbi:ribosome small subunit-dependent GTPase A [Kineococcus esterisolvens]|uniref:ribosome small subunit-dependent GTPase A n=1 Tax=unclassified Kineococcus TaxID=2621656 RepID=UPI003D7DA84C
MTTPADEKDATHPLGPYGWDERWELALAQHHHDHPGPLVPARVGRTHRGALDVQTPLGPQRVTLARAVLPVPTTGDWVVLGLAGSEPELLAVLPRRTALTRAEVSGRSAEQVLAANVDTVLVTVAPARRAPLGRVERFLTLAWNSGAQPVVVLTKTDLIGGAELAKALADVEGSALGAPVLAVSAERGAGIEDLRRALSGTVALIGPSGAGKSTLANALLGQERFATGAVRSGDGKGRHTTVHRELLPLPGGLVLVDTPGLRSVGLGAEGSTESLQRTFADVEDLAVDCRFADCSHTSEPGCAVLSAIEAGVVDRRRLDSYRKLEREQEWFAARTDARLRAERAQRWKVIHKQQRAHRPRP